MSTYVSDSCSSVSTHRLNHVTVGPTEEFAFEFHLGCPAGGAAVSVASVHRLNQADVCV